MITLSQVSKSFKGNIAVDNLSLDIAKGEILGLLGANGAGKSTTIHMLLGFIKPDSGAIQVDDVDAINNSETARQLIGYIPENVSLYNHLSGIENLDYFCKIANLKYSEPELEEFLSTCGLQAEAHKQKISSYSKGMRQKVGIAVAYAKKAKVLLLDEPASGLDPLASNELSELLKSIASSGTSILMASHDIFRVREVCHRIGILKNGVLVKELNSKDVSANELEALYLQYMQN
ncbi:ATP-binding cassette domain-containing protein [Winogradskyella sp.]|uniref:ABC transporter ATP-binding protein n=1 Tax=Winogradskyella sp. TaxID=1883156 RepID=UPI0026072387|nr:ATP-binding cassette domain-containing protein [Winogradskyella sp.]